MSEWLTEIFVENELESEKRQDVGVVQRGLWGLYGICVIWVARSCLRSAKVDFWQQILCDMSKRSLLFAEDLAMTICRWRVIDDWSHDSKNWSSSHACISKATTVSCSLVVGFVCTYTIASPRIRMHSQLVRLQSILWGFSSISDHYGSVLWCWRDSLRDISSRFEPVGLRHRRIGVDWKGFGWICPKDWRAPALCLQRKAQW